MQPFPLEAREFYKNFESQTNLKGEKVSETTKEYRVKPYESFKVGFGRTKIAYSFFGIGYDYYYYLQGEILGGKTPEDYWKAASNSVEFEFKQKIFSKGEPHFFSSPQAEVAEKKIGRSLKKNEIVHHIDGLRSNNSPDNLHVCLRKEHKGIHADMEIIVYELLDAGRIIFSNGTYQWIGE